MCTLLQLFAIGLYLFNGVLAQQSRNFEYCGQNQACNNTARYLNASLTPAERADDLLQRLTWEEKVGQMGGIRSPFSSVNGSISFNTTSFEKIKCTQNGQIGKPRSSLHKQLQSPSD